MSELVDLLKLCGFEDGEILEQQGRIDRAFDRLEISSLDIHNAIQRVRASFNVDLLGMRKILRLWIKELINMVLAREENRKIVYRDWILQPQISLTHLRACKDVYCGTVDELIGVTLGQIFDKHVPILEAGERAGLTPGNAHCASNLLLVGAVAKGIVPLPDLLISADNMCDQTAVAAQLLHEVYDVPVVYVDGPLDSSWDLYPSYNKRLVKYVGSQIDKAQRKFEEVTGCVITKENEKEGHSDNGSYWRRMQDLVQLMAQDPQPISYADAVLFWWLAPTPMRDRAGVHDALDTLIKEVEERVHDGKGVVEKGAPTIYWYLPNCVDATIVKMVEHAGLHVAANGINYIPKAAWVKHQETEFGARLAEGNLRRPWLVSACGVMQEHKTVCKDFNVDGFIYSYPIDCRPLASCAVMERDFIEKELGIPTMLMETTIFDNRMFNIEQMRTRVETFAAILKARKKTIETHSS